ncbi:MAG: HigA family addiction module antitoxin [Desulfobacula sp.]|nr:HigA family addiction module antitoxin [Desulfobacula sp.]
MSKEKPPIHPGAYVKKNLIPNELTIKKASEMMGIGRPALSNFLNCRSNLSSNMAIRLEKTFGVDKDFLLNIQQKYDSFINHEEAKRIAVKSYTPSFLNITSTQIEAWADKIEARSLLPVLLRRLVNTTSADIIESDFPAYDKSQTPGWDGTVESNSATAWISSGLSGWEFGCNKNPKKKADSDFKTRTETIPKDIQKKTTFVFVTPRCWPKKDEWIKLNKATGEWKDLRAFDANDIEQWLELSASAQIWMAEQLGLPTSDCQSLASYWQYWSETATPPISSKIFNSAILDHSKKIKSWYRSNQCEPLIITGASKDEAKAFLCCIANEVNALKPLFDIALFVSSSNLVTKLSGISQNYIPIIDNDEAQKGLITSFKDKHSIIISERNINGMEADIIIDLPNYESFKAALDDMGFDDAQIDVISNQSGHSPTILRRLLAKAPGLKKPKWAKSNKIFKAIIPFIFAGSWEANRNGDKEILMCLANKDYSQIEKDLAEILGMDDSPIWREGQYRGVISKLECLYSVSDQITAEDMNNFFEIAEYVLSEDDPALDLKKEDQWAANIYNKVRDHSSAIRKSICQNLIILSVHGNGLFGKRIGMDLEGRVSILIKTLLKNKNSRVWQSQQNELLLYAEAAPEMFLSIVEEELRKDIPAFNILFEPVKGGLFTRCDRTGMLWALEILAWNSFFLARVIKILGKLSTYDLDDNWVNKPINSLKDILLFWKPHTAATVEQRCDVLELLCNSYPKIGWKLCIQTLNSENSFTSGTQRPNWRNYASGSGSTINNGEARIFVLKCLKLVLSWPSHTLETLKGLIDCLPSLENDDRQKVIEQVKLWVDNSPDEDEVLELREHVRTRTMTTRALKNDRNKSNPSYVSGKELYEILEPQDLVKKHQWLFANSWVEFTPEELENDNLDYDDREIKLTEQRKKALNKIVTKKGIRGVIVLLEKCGSGFHIGSLLHGGILEKHELYDVISKCLSIDKSFRSEINNCISGILYQMKGKERKNFISDMIAEICLKKNRSDMIVKLFTLSPFCRDTWEHLNNQEKDIIDKYWRHIEPGWRDLSSEDLNYAVEKLVETKRPFAAFFLAHLKPNLILSKHLVLLLNEIAYKEADYDKNYKPSQYHIEESLKILNERDDYDRLELIKLEYLYSDMLYFNSKYGIPNLSKEISETPLLFYQLVAHCFKSRSGANDPEEWNIPQDKTAKKNLATKAYHVLQSINVIPGTKKDGSIEVDQLRDWVLQVRKLSAKYGRRDITDQQIGKLFSTSPEGMDGIWPKEEIRIVFEEIESSEISIGMEIGLQNSHGAEFRKKDSTREIEREEKYRTMAKKVMNKTPFVARMLNNIADGYARNAEWWNEQSRVDKRLHGW